MSITSICGITESRIAPIIAKYAKERNQGIVVCSNMEKAKNLAIDLSFFIKDKEVIVLDSTDNFFLMYDAKNRDELLNRLNVLKKLSNREKVMVVCPISSFIKKLAPHTIFSRNSFTIKVGDFLDLEEVKEKLVALGYERNSMIETKGEFSVRGGIVDIFTPDSEFAYRVEFFGDEVDSIRAFNVSTQISIENLKEINIYPATGISIDNEIFKNAIENIDKAYSKEIKKADGELKENLEKTKNRLVEMISEVKNVQLLEKYVHYFFGNSEYLYDYMYDGTLFISEPDRIFEELKNIDNENENDFNYLLSRGELIKNDKCILSGTEDFIKSFNYSSVFFLSPFMKKIRGVDEYDNLVTIQSRETLKYNGNMDSFLGDIKEYIKKNYDITIVCESKDRIKSILDFFLDSEIHGNIKYEIGKITAGIEYPEEKKVWIAEEDIFKIKKKTRKTSKFDDNSSKLRKFTDIREGDYVVHINHGIGKFVGIKQMSIENEKKDYIMIKYAGTDMLYVPVEHLDLVQKYIGSVTAPKINRLSGTEWKKTKEKTKKEILLMAQDLIDLYAKRSSEDGYKFGPDTVWQNEFEDDFPYQETEDQLRASEEIKKDMEKPMPMDRLLLGDVGFGKTEVAARAAFKCLTEGKQVCFLVPTTVLANQHYYTLKERFEKFPFKVEVLSRFKGKTSQDKIVRDLASGRVDFVIGTHRLLSKDVKFKDLGLLIVDEEQRFGVEAKENIKKLKTNVDCLTLTATPIPRTLNMSLNGIKDMSLLETPPLDRYPVQTYVLEEDDEIIKDAINRELNRNGQVYIVYNRITGINAIVKRISELVPEARVAYGHGRMHENELEDVMYSFINHEVDVLVSTTIVESGLDIPNANTMIVLDSDRYGLSQLYQLRGRVGRTNRIAYCYLMHEPYKVLNEVAEKRLNAIREFTEFGSGFKIAIRDLEIRGAGNLLGEAQSGHMSGVGYELYIKMIDDAVRALKGEIVNDKEKETTIEIPVSAYIPGTYIEDEIIKMDVYKKIASIRTDEDENDIFDELVDRFGDVPNEVINLMKISHIRYICEEIGVSRVFLIKQEIAGTTVKSKKVKVMFDFYEDNKLNAFSIYNLNELMTEYVFIHLGKKPYITLSCNRDEMLDKALEMLPIIMDNRSTSVVQ